LRRIAYHQAGHAFVGWREMPDDQPLQYCTIVHQPEHDATGHAGFTALPADFYRDVDLNAEGERRVRTLVMVYLAGEVA